MSEQGHPQWASSYLHDDAGSMAAQSLSAAEEGGVPTTQRGEHGSNIWVVGARKARNRRAIIANDPHLSLGSPSTFYEVGIDVKSPGTRLTLYGVTFPGAPLIVQGTNGRVSWGSTVNPTDVTDVYQEQLTIAGGVPGGDHLPGQSGADADHPGDVPRQPGRQQHARMTSSRCRRRQAFPPATVVVPRRNNGPIISVTRHDGILRPVHGLQCHA